ncbi:MAG: hypothetical protein J3R72DRAFT_445244 [Linnemannia gamsii]|nr:MAG: hypothetical protein J3R72DRAFT_445244 [Linnemannia gamsii]
MRRKSAHLLEAVWFFSLLDLKMLARWVSFLSYSTAVLQQAAVNGIDSISTGLSCLFFPFSISNPPFSHLVLCLLSMLIQ